MQATSLVVAIHLAALLAAAVAAPAAHAQYRWVGPDGAVTYSDMPPPSGAQPVATLAAPSPAADAALPLALRTTAAKHPVTLYVSDECSPCQQARSHLAARGIPFAERSIRTPDDVEAFRRAGFAGDGVPALGVGRDRATGYEAGAWDRLLDAAGYPRTSMLPRGYRHPDARSLAEPAPPAPARVATAEAVADSAGSSADESAIASATAAPPGQSPDSRTRGRAVATQQGAAPTLRF
jgi:hypothetical protein